MQQRNLSNGAALKLLGIGIGSSHDSILHAKKKIAELAVARLPGWTSSPEQLPLPVHHSLKIGCHRLISYVVCLPFIYCLFSGSLILLI